MSVIAEIEAALPALHRYASSLVAQRQDADDLVQETMVRALGQLHRSGDAGLSVRPWLFTILHNLNVSRWRSLRRWAWRSGAEDVETPVPPAQDDALASRDLLRAFDALPPAHRQVLLLVSVEGLEYRDAAAVLGVPVGTVMSRLSRARDALRAGLEGTTRRDAPARPVLRRVK